MQERLICLLFVLTLLTIPQILVYKYFDGYNYTDTESSYASMSFGNMGYAGNSCGVNFIDWSVSEKITHVSLQCQGTARIRGILDAGIVDVNARGEENSVDEFHRCFYQRPIDYDTFPIMRSFQED